MYAVEFITEWRGGLELLIPAEAAARLPETGKVRVIVLTENPETVYEQIPRQDPAEDSDSRV